MLFSVNLFMKLLIFYEMTSEDNFLFCNHKYRYMYLISSFIL